MHRLSKLVKVDIICNCDASAFLLLASVKGCLMADIVATCVDKRMEKVLPELLPQLGVNIGDYHRMTAFGGSLGLDHEFQLCELIVDNLHAHRVNVLDHMDCKAFRKKFGADLSPEREQQLHIERLRQRAEQIRKEFPEVREVRLFLLTEVSPDFITPTATRVDFS